MSAPPHEGPKSSLNSSIEGDFLDQSAEHSRTAVHHAQHLKRQRCALGAWVGWCGPGSLFLQRFSDVPVFGGLGGVRLRGGRFAGPVVALPAAAVASALALCGSPPRRATHPPALCGGDCSGVLFGAAPGFLAAVDGGLSTGLAGHLAGLCHRLSLPEFDCRLLFLE